MFYDTVSYSEFREHLKSYLDRVEDDCAPLRIKRRNGKKLVVIPEDYFNSMDETEYLLASPANARHLRKALKEPKKRYKRYKSVDAIRKEFEIK